MNFKWTSAALFLLFGIAWILLIVSFNTYWYRIQDGEDDDIIEVFFSYNHVNIVYHGDIYDYVHRGIHFMEVIESYHYNFPRILKICFGFAIAAWLSVSLTLLFIILSLAGILAKIPLPLPTITKIVLPVVSLLLCLASMCTFFASSKARLDTSQYLLVKLFPVSYSDCGTVYNCSHEKFTFVFDNQYGKGGPYTGWAVVVGSFIVKNVKNI
ncbi:hypothetical protein DFA_11967 [Cavenderia fasciculata]|uniref:Transmembrane protein n=1 Tax=Cavenderia fasciculata TaxID=261658 RepID=F4QF44_CACFS|nr:uncharacterized protein DFA_11967 [Cavenderia fasciculata]EGG14198.1 hypothetical protein DFA_11967 [Cavenderia fasciculata]|eukprot:XP_004350906.1 hypothetical protein DFA_11967 [Cavenderia fasciculata]